MAPALPPELPGRHPCSLPGGESGPDLETGVSISSGARVCWEENASIVEAARARHAARIGKISWGKAVVT